MISSVTVAMPSMASAPGSRSGAVPRTAQIGGRHLAAFAGDLEQAVLVHRPLDAGRQVERLPGFEALDVFEYVARVRLDGRLAQPGQPGRLAVVVALEQIVEAVPVGGRRGSDKAA